MPAAFSSGGHGAGNSEELIRIALQVIGQEGLADLQSQLDYNKVAVKQLAEAFANGSISVDEYERAAKKLAASETQLKRVMDQTTEGLKAQQAAADGAAEAVDTVSEATKKSGINASGAARGVLELSRGIEDFVTGGPLGILNNIPGIFSGIGSAAGLSSTAVAGLTAGVSLLATAAFVTWKNWGAISEAIGLTEKAKESVDSLKAKVEELNKKPIKLAADYKELDEAEARLAKIEARAAAFEAGKGSEPEKALGSEAAKVTSGHLGGSDAAEAVVLAMEKASGFQHGDQKDLDLIKSLTEAIAKAPGTQSMVREKQMLAAAQGRVNDASSAYAHQQVQDFNAGDPAAIAAMKRRAEQNPGAFSRVGLDGKTGAEALGAMPGSIDEIIARQRAEKQAAAEDAREAEGQRQVNKVGEGWKYVQGIWDEEATKATAAEDKKREGEQQRRIELAGGLKNLPGSKEWEDETKKQDGERKKHDALVHKNNEARRLAGRGGNLADLVYRGEANQAAQAAQGMGIPLGQAQQIGQAAAQVHANSGGMATLTQSLDQVLVLIGQGLSAQQASTASIAMIQQRIRRLESYASQVSDFQQRQGQGMRGTAGSGTAGLISY